MIPCIIAGCYTAYDRAVLPKDDQLPVEKKQVVLYRGDEAYSLDDVKITDERLEATIENPRLLWGVFKRPIPEKERTLNIYVDPTFEIPEVLPARVPIPFSAIDEIEVYDVNTGKTVLINVGCVAAIIVAFIIYFAIASCPFVYAFEGEDYEFTGEIFAGAIFPPLERHDYLTLPQLKPSAGEYRVKLANEANEIQYINLAELWVLDHPRGSEVLVDKYGVPHTLADTRPPAEALTLAGKDVRDAVAEADGTTYMGDVIDEADGDVDGLVLTFPRPPDARAAKLVLRGKNSFWLEYVFNRLSELFGDRYGEWYEGQRWAAEEKLRRWLREQGIYLSVCVERDGEWEFAGYFDFVGPIAAKDDVLPLDVSGARPDEVRVKLEFGSLFWEIDYVGLDYSADLPVRQRSVPPAGAVDLEGRDVSYLLIRDDGLYYVQTEIGEEVFLTFYVSEPAEGLARTAVLHSKGHYEVLRTPRGEADLRSLYSFRKPGRFIEFSKELFLNLYRPAAYRED